MGPVATIRCMICPPSYESLRMRAGTTGPIFGSQLRAPAGARPDTSLAPLYARAQRLATYPRESSRRHGDYTESSSAPTSREPEAAVPATTGFISADLKKMPDI